MRALIVFVIGLVFGVTGGFLAAGGLGPSSHDHAGHDDANHDMLALTDWSGAAPNLGLALMADNDSAVNLHIQTTGFAFAPEQVNGPVTQASGHAHIYINGEMVRRAYGPWVHLTDVPTGAKIRVTLHANDHAGWALNGKPIAAEATAP